MRNLIKVNDQYLIFRDHARVLKEVILKELKERNTSEVCLDFSQVHFISRSFADEFLEIINCFKKEKSKKIKVINKNPFIGQLLDIVENQKEKIKKELSLQI